MAGPEPRMKTLLLTLLALAALAALGAVAFVQSGLYDVSATQPHTHPVYRLVEHTMHRAVQRRARSIEVPPLQDAALLQRGAACYRDHCLACHGGPGVAPGAAARGMQPLPGPLIDAPARWRPAELFWLTRHGIKMSGMPAWGHRLHEDEIWAVVAYVGTLPGLSPQAFRAGMAPSAGPRCVSRTERLAAVAVLPADAARGELALQQHACTSCHTIPGIPGPKTQVGPPLDGFARRTRIAGDRLPNSADALAEWIRHPQRLDPHTAMPDLQVGEQDALDMAAYLATLH